MACKVSGGAVAFDRTGFTEQRRRLCTPSKSLHCIDSNPINKKIEISRGNVHLSKGSWLISRQPHSYARPRKHPVLCYSMGSQSNESRECVRNSEDCKNLSSEQLENEQTGGCGTQVCDKVINAKISAYSIVYNDAKYVNERARNDIVLLSRGIRQLDDRARQDVAVLGLGILRLDARAREDTEKIDHGMKRKAACLHHITSILKDKAKSKLKRAADQHWSDGALEADLRRADFVVRRRAMEDAFMALKFVRNIHDMMASKLYQQDVSTDRIAAIQDAYWSMASALSEADGIDYTDPEELEMLVSALIDLDAMDGKDSVSLLAECSSSPDVSTRQALANALAAAPSMWILGNAGMGALQRLAEDSNPAIAAAASKAIDELKLQWELEEGDSLRFLMNRISQETGDDSDSEENGDYQV
ncbi:uncharacterized protein LOC109829255 isoform X2 [Asparagus officinalis]|uniref:uncharacterized protein LOC109829255 isoform X2 n=1 Tax=Asparagus officinalis TaxID=4686 RepID=UPI00098E016C|nr:uncharacterized protein LOC109829255 isoform X2 [Asparagus officinalis]